jgi:hypothetical protein
MTRPAATAQDPAETATAAHTCDAAKKSLLMSFNLPLPPAPAPVRLVLPPVNTLAFAALPRWARKLYGAPGSPVTDVVTSTRPAEPPAAEPGHVSCASEHSLGPIRVSRWRPHHKTPRLAVRRKDCRGTHPAH